MRKYPILAVITIFTDLSDLINTVFFLLQDRHVEPPPPPPSPIPSHSAPTHLSPSYLCYPKPNLSPHQSTGGEKVSLTINCRSGSPSDLTPNLCYLKAECHLIIQQMSASGHALSVCLSVENFFALFFILSSLVV